MKKGIIIHFLIFGFPIVLILLLLLYFNVFDKKTDLEPSNINQNKPSENIFHYDISKLKKVDLSLVKYKEINPIAVDEYPSALSIDSQSRLFVVLSNEILIFIKGKLIRKISIDFISDSIVGISILSSHDKVVLVSDSNIYLIGIGEGSKGRLIASVDLSKRSDNCSITSITSTNDYIFIADAGSRLIFCFNKQLKFVRELRGDPDSGFIIPSNSFDIAGVDNNSIWAVNPGMRQFEKYDSSGNLVAWWNAPKSGIEGFSGCCNPAYFVISAKGEFITAEKHILRVKKYAPNGKFEYVIVPPSKFNKNAKINGVAIDNSDIVYIIDSCNKSIRRFKHK